MSDAIAYFILAVALAMLGFTAVHEARRKKTWSTKNRALRVLCPLGILLSILFGIEHLQGEPSSLQGFDWFLFIAFFVFVAWGLVVEMRTPA